RKAIEPHQEKLKQIHDRPEVKPLVENLQKADAALRGQTPGKGPTARHLDDQSKELKEQTNQAGVDKGVTAAYLAREWQERVTRLLALAAEVNTARFAPKFQEAEGLAKANDLDGAKGILDDIEKGLRDDLQHIADAKQRVALLEKTVAAAKNT